MNKKFFVFASPSLLLTAGLAFAQTSTETPFVLESVSYLTVDEYADSGNEVDVSATEDVDENAISYESFLPELAEARAAGLGGVIDFEIDLPGDNLRAIDKTLINAYVVDLVLEGQSRDAARSRALDNFLVAADDDPYTGPLDALDGSDEAFWYDVGDPVDSFRVSNVPGYTFSAEPAEDEIQATDLGDGSFARVNPTRIIVVEDRFDRDADDANARPLWSEGQRIIYSELRGIYGLNSENSITIQRGARNLRERSLATRAAPGDRELGNTDPNLEFGSGSGPINDEFFFGTDVVSGSRVAISGARGMSGGGEGQATAKDMLFDPRDNIVTLGFTLLSFGNFQYWQGLGTEPDNPDNIIVTATFRDQESGEQFVTDYRGTTQQSTGGADTFFGIEAPSGAAITRLQVRVVGRNFRTFTNIDDLAFITEPSAPYISAGADQTLVTPYVAVGRPFYRLLEFQRNPQSVVFEGPSGEDLADYGLSFDLETGIISGTPPESIIPDGEDSAEIVMDVTMTNSAGTRVEQVRFEFRKAAEDSALPVFTSSPNTTAILGREFSYTAVSTLTGVSKTNLDYLLVAKKVNDDGSETVFPLETLGLSLSDDRLIGTPVRSDLVGEYKLTFYAVTPEGSTESVVILQVIPSTAIPNFDATSQNTQTDFIYYDGDNGTVQIALFSKEGEDGPLVLGEAVTIFDELPAGTEVFIGDFNGDANTDVLAYARSSGVAELCVIEGTTFNKTILGNTGENSDWEILGVGDLNIDGTEDLILQNRSSGQAIAWILRQSPFGETPRPSVISFGPFLFEQDETDRFTLLEIADYNGDGGSDLLWQNNRTDEYLLMPFSAESFTSSQNPVASLERINRTSFTMEPGFEYLASTDVGADGVDDIVWINRSTGIVAIWEMSNEPEEFETNPPAAFFEGSKSGGNFVGTAIAGDNTLVANDDLGVLETITDLNGDNRGDLLFSRGDNMLNAILFDGPVAFSGQVDRREDGVTARPQVRRDQDLGSILKDTRDLRLGSGFVSGEISIRDELEGDESLNEFPDLGANGGSPVGSYQIFEQAVEVDEDGVEILDDEGNSIYVWNTTSDPFHAYPVADLDKPLLDEDGGRLDIWFEEFLQAGQALGDYRIFKRTALGEGGKPLARKRQGFRFVVGDVKTEIQNLARSGSQDFVWTPMEQALDGSLFEDGIDGVANFDARGNRGFLRAVDIDGQPLGTDAAPVYEPWRNSEGRTVLGQSIYNLLKGSIENTTAEFWLRPTLENPLLEAFDSDPSDADTVYANRVAITNGIIDGLTHLSPSLNLPSKLPAALNDFDVGMDEIGFDVVNTTNENLVENAVKETFLNVRNEVAGSLAAVLGLPVVYDDLGLPIVYDEHALVKVFYEDGIAVPIFDEENDPVFELDGDGNLITDDDGNPNPVLDENGNGLLLPPPVYDGDGSLLAHAALTPFYDLADGDNPKIVFEEVKDESGTTVALAPLIQDENGNRVSVYTENGIPDLDESGNPIPVVDEGGYRLTRLLFPPAGFVEVDVEAAEAGFLYQEDNSEQEKLDKIENAIVEAVTTVTTGGIVIGDLGLTTEDIDLYDLDQLDAAMRTLISERFDAAVRATSLLDSVDPDGSAASGDAFSFVADDLELFLLGGDTDEYWSAEFEYAILDALHIVVEKLQTLAVKVAITEAVNKGFGLEGSDDALATFEVPLDLVFLGSNPFNRLAEDNIDARIETAILQAIVAAGAREEVLVQDIVAKDLNYEYNIEDSASAKGTKIREAIVAGIKAAGGTIELADVVLNYPAEVKAENTDAINVSYSADVSFEENAESIFNALLSAFNSQFEESLTEEDFSAEGFFFYTVDELEDLLVNALTIAVDKAGGGVDEISDNVDLALSPEEEADGVSVEVKVRESIYNAVTAAFVDTEVRRINLASLDFPLYIDTDAQVEAIKTALIQTVVSHEVDPEASPEEQAQQVVSYLENESALVVLFPDIAATVPASFVDDYFGFDALNPLTSEERSTLIEETIEDFTLEFVPETGSEAAMEFFNLAQASEIEIYLTSTALRRVFPSAEGKLDQFSVDYVNAIDTATRSEEVWNAITGVIAQNIPGDSYSIPEESRLNLVDETNYHELNLDLHLSRVLEDAQDAATEEALEESLEFVLADLGYNFPGFEADTDNPLPRLQQAVPPFQFDEDPSNDRKEIEDYIASVLNEGARGESAAEGAPGADHADPVLDRQFVLNGDLPSDWQRTLQFIAGSVDALFPGPAPDLTQADGFTGQTFNERGESVMEVVADALTQATGQIVETDDLAAFAFPAEADVLLYELDYERFIPGSDRNINEENFAPTIDIPAGFELIATGDYDNNGGIQQDLFLLNAETGEYQVFIMNGITVTQEYSGQLGGGFGPVISAFDLWLRDNFGNESLPIADEDADPDGDRASNLLEYASGVTSVYDECPTMPTLSINDSGDFELEFCVLDSDADLAFTVMGSSDMIEWEEVGYEFLDKELSIGAANRYRVRLEDTDGEYYFYSVDYRLTE